jgi:glycerophosphoryl diester phosphodiesterase
MNTYQRRTFLKTTLLAAAATVTTPVSAALRRWSQKPNPDRGIHHPFFAQAHKPDVIAHRAGNGEWPGETMYAMRKAQAIGSDVLEMDVYLTKDQELILMHNSEVKSTTGASGHVYDYTVNEITALRADRRWSPSECGSSLSPEEISQHERDLHVPTLRQVLTEFSGMRMVIEMKKAPKEFSPVAKLSALLTELNLTQQVLVASFHKPFMEDFRRALPEVATSLTLSITDAAVLTSHASEQLINKLSSNKQRPDALELPHWAITNRVVKKAKEHGLALHAWTVNSTEAMDRMKSRGVDGIITDCPTRLLTRLGRPVGTTE